MSDTAIDTPKGSGCRYLRWKEVERVTGLSRTTAWRLQRQGDFPRPYVISPGRVGYLESEVEAWSASRRRRGSEGPLATETQEPRRPNTRPADRKPVPPTEPTPRPPAQQITFDF